MPRRDVNYLKPEKFRNYLTISELAEAVGKDISWLRRLEQDARIPKASRVKRGELQIRLYSPAQVKEIRTILATMKPGRPSK